MIKNVYQFNIELKYREYSSETYFVAEFADLINEKVGCLELLSLMRCCKKVGENYGFGSYSGNGLSKHRLTAYTRPTPPDPSLPCSAPPKSIADEQ